jgi:hypothetical protein
VFQFSCDTKGKYTRTWFEGFCLPPHALVSFTELFRISDPYVVIPDQLNILSYALAVFFKTLLFSVTLNYYKRYDYVRN